MHTKGIGRWFGIARAGMPNYQHARIRGLVFRQVPTVKLELETKRNEVLSPGSVLSEESFSEPLQTVIESLRPYEPLLGLYASLTKQLMLR